MGFAHFLIVTTFIISATQAYSTHTHTHSSDAALDLVDARRCDPFCCAACPSAAAATSGTCAENPIDSCRPSLSLSGAVSSQAWRTDDLTRGPYNAPRKPGRATAIRMTSTYRGMRTRRQAGATRTAPANKAPTRVLPPAHQVRP